MLEFSVIQEGPVAADIFINQPITAGKMFALVVVLGLCILCHGRQQNPPQSQDHRVPSYIESTEPRRTHQQNQDSIINTETSAKSPNLNYYMPDVHENANPEIGGNPSSFKLEDSHENYKDSQNNISNEAWNGRRLRQRSQNQSSAGHTRSNSSQADEGYQYAKPAIGGKPLSTFTFEDFPESPRNQNTSTLNTLRQRSQNQSSAGQNRSNGSQADEGYQYAKPAIGGKPVSTFTFEDFPESPRSQHTSTLSPAWSSIPQSQRSQNQSSAGQNRSNGSQADEGYQYAKPAIGGKPVSTFTFEDFPESPRNQNTSTLNTLRQRSQNQSSAGQNRSNGSQADEGYQYAKPAIGGKPVSTFTFEDFPESPRSQHTSTLSPAWSSIPQSQRSQNQSSAGQNRSNGSQADEGYQYAKPAIGAKPVSTFTFEDFPESPRSRNASTLHTQSQRSQNQSSAAGHTRSHSSQADEGYQYAKPAIGGKPLSTFTFTDFPESPRNQNTRFYLYT